VQPVADDPGVGVGDVVVDADGVLVGTGRGAVRLGEVQPAGKRMLGASDWARGARPQPGERVGE
jgi:methionyl-tRNA formyltransferase